MMSTAVPDVLGARAAVDVKLRRMAGVQRRLDALCAEMDRRMAAVRTRYDRRVAALRARYEALASELEAICRARRDEVFEDGRQSYRTPHGQVAFRRAEPAVEVREGLDDAGVCRLLRRGRLGRLVRMREGLDRQAVRRALADGEVSRERLARSGLTLRE